MEAPSCAVSLGTLTVVGATIVGLGGQ